LRLRIPEAAIQPAPGKQGPYQLAIAEIVFQMKDLDSFGRGGLAFVAANRGRTVHGHFQRLNSLIGHCLTVISRTRFELCQCEIR
jgi:hypothetical protein